MPSLISHKLSIIKYVVLKKIIFFFLCFDRLIWTWTWLGLEPLWTRSWLGLEPLWTRSWLGLEPLWTWTCLGLDKGGLDYSSNTHTHTHTHTYIFVCHSSLNIKPVSNLFHQHFVLQKKHFFSLLCCVCVPLGERIYIMQFIIAQDNKLIPTKSSCLNIIQNTKTGKLINDQLCTNSPAIKTAQPLREYPGHIPSVCTQTHVWSEQ